MSVIPGSHCTRCGAFNRPGASCFACGEEPPPPPMMFGGFCQDRERCLKEAGRYHWLVENPGLAMLAFAEATNVDTFGIEWKDGKPIREVTSEEYCRYLHARIDELMQERREPQLHDDGN